MKLLIIPDAHSRPCSTSDRFTWLGKYIVDERPDTIVCLGDFMDFESLSSYDKGTTGAEGKRVALDLQAGKRDLDALFAPLRSYNADRRRSRKARYLPSTYITLGNHEHRLTKFASSTPEWHGAVPTLGDIFSPYFDAVVPFKQPLFIEGIAFSHFFPSKMGRAIGGMNAARTVLQKTYMSSVCGHSHEYDLHIATRVNGEKMFGMVAGWYGDLDHEEAWSRGTDHSWWNGVTMLHDVKDGFFQEDQRMTQSKLRYLYGQDDVS